MEVNGLRGDLGFKSAVTQTKEEERLRAAGAAGIGWIYDMHARQ